MIIGITAASVVGSLVIKALIDRKNALDFAKEFDQNRNVQSIDNLPNYNIATKDMFIDTQYLNFHMGHPGIGHYGWLGTYQVPQQQANSQGYDDSTLTLTSWNQEVLWVNDELKGYKIYDVKYECNSKLLFVVRHKPRTIDYSMNIKYDYYCSWCLNRQTKVIDSSDIGLAWFYFSLPNTRLIAGANYSSERQKYNMFQDMIYIGNIKTYLLIKNWIYYS